MRVSANAYISDLNGPIPCGSFDVLANPDRRWLPPGAPVAGAPAQYPEDRGRGSALDRRPALPPLSESDSATGKKPTRSPSPDLSTEIESLENQQSADHQETESQDAEQRRYRVSERVRLNSLRFN